MRRAREKWRRAAPASLRDERAAEGRAAESADSGERDARTPLGAGFPLLVLDPPRESANAFALEPTGADAGAPRALWLWRVDGERPVVVARGTSARDGAIEFPPLLVPQRGLALVATPEGVRPGEPGASATRSIEPPPPAPPSVRLLGVDPETAQARLRVFPRAPTGEIVVADAEGRELARREIPPAPDAARRVLELALELPAEASELRVRHAQRSDRTSAWQPVALDAEAVAHSNSNEGEHDAQ